MSEMVERVARAITEAFEREARVFDEGQAEFLARAAIEAMREPTPEMIAALKPLGDLGVQILRCEWIAMIDEALNGSKTPSE